MTIDSNLGPVLAMSQRYGDLNAENRHFSIVPTPLTPLLGVNPFEFLDEPNWQKQESYAMHQ